MSFDRGGAMYAEKCLFARINMGVHAMRWRIFQHVFWQLERVV